MLHVILVEPEIPQNTGNIARTCAVTGAKLHLIEPLGFDVSDAAVKRAGLDYWRLLDITTYPNLDNFFVREFSGQTDAQLWLLSKKAERLYTEVDFTLTGECYFMFGKETKGLSDDILSRFADKTLKIPMIDNPAARSLNLGNAVAITLYEAIRQFNA
jgi:tRNA (cytidine/uridine-2'-O-)-methyltransferase